MSRSLLLIMSLDFGGEFLSKLKPAKLIYQVLQVRRLDILFLVREQNFASYLA